LAHESSATIYTIGLYDEDDTDRDPRALKKIAGDSGGRAFLPETPTELGQAWLDIASGIRSQYTIGFTSTNAARNGAFRKVMITVANHSGKKYTIQTRKGYMAPRK
jgi:Ca-activated chloride channel family protein